MRRSLLVTNIAILAGIGWMLAQGTEHKPTPILPSVPTSVNELSLATLEAKVALSPTPADVAALASAYLERDQPGLASALIEKTPRELRASVDVSLAQSRALFRRGLLRQALAVSRETHEACERSTLPCTAWQFAKVERQRVFLEQVVSAGIEDPQAEPEATRAAYERSKRIVRLVAMQ